MATIAKEGAETLGRALGKETPKAVSKAVSRGQLLQLAEKVKEEYKKTESVKDIADKLGELVEKDPDVFSAVKGASKNTKLQLEALREIPTFKNQLGQALAQPPRSVREAAKYSAEQQAKKKAEEEASRFDKPATLVRREYPDNAQGLEGLAGIPDVTPGVGAGGFGGAVEIPRTPTKLELDMQEYRRKLKESEEGQGLEGLAETPDVVPSGAGGFGSAVEQPKETLPEPTPSAPGGKRSLASAIGAGTVALGGAGAIAGLTGGEKTPPLSETYAPVARPDGTIGMSEAEFKAIEKEKGTVAALREQDKKYADLNDRFLEQQRQVYKDTRMTPPDLSTPSGRQASQVGAQKFLSDLRAEQAAPATQAEPSAPAATAPVPGPTEKKELTVKPAPSSGGMDKPETTQPGVVPTKEPTPQVAESQAELPDDIVGLYRLSERMAGGGRTVDRKSIIDALENLKRLEDDIAVLYDKDPPPALKEIGEARRQAYEAYKEKATRNEWLGIIDKAIGALGQFASAKSALGTAYIGNYRPSTADYQEKTQQALREFQTEVGLLEKEREESKEARQQAIKEQETVADRLTRQRQLEVKQAEEKVRQQQDVVDRADSLTKTFFNANVDFERQKMQTAAAEKKQAAATIEDQKKATSDLLRFEIDGIQENIKQVQRLKEAAAVVAADPSDANVAKLAALYPGDLQQAIKDDPSWTDASSTKAVAKELVASNTDILNKLQSDLQAARQAQKQNITGQTQAPSVTFSKADVEDAVRRRPGWTYEQAKKFYESQGYRIVE